MRLVKIKLILLFYLLLLGLPAHSDNSLSLYINSAEGGEMSIRRIQSLKNYFKDNGCVIQEIFTAEDINKNIHTDFIFNPLADDYSDDYRQLSKIQVLNNEALSMSILVRASTGISDLKDLNNVRLALFSEKSITGYQIPQIMFNNAGIVFNPELITFTQTNIGAMALLLHKDVFTAVIATPLANKWLVSNDLKIVNTSEIIQTGGLWVKNRLLENKVTAQMAAHCQQAFSQLFEKPIENKSLIRLFPSWIKGLSSTQK